MKDSVNSVMGNSVIIRAALGLFIFPNSTLQKRVEAVLLQQNLDWHNWRKTNTSSSHRNAFRDAEGKETCVID